MNKGQIIILDHCFLSHFSSVISYFFTYLLFLWLSFWFYLSSFLFICLSSGFRYLVTKVCLLPWKRTQFANKIKSQWVYAATKAVLTYLNSSPVLLGSNIFFTWFLNNLSRNYESTFETHFKLHFPCKAKSIYIESSKDVVDSVARFTWFHSKMGKETFQGGNEIICYDIAPPPPPLRPSDLKPDLTCWRKLHCAETAQFNTTSFFLKFP